MELSLYIHIPYCLQKCSYCDFNSQETPSGVPDDYMAALLAEMQTRRHYLPRDATAKTLYVGGGTPSLVPPDEIAALVAMARHSYALADTAEVTMEANPGTLNLERLKSYRSAGINRLSLGIQSFDDGMLRILGRIHSAASAIDAFQMGRDAGFDNIGIDLIHTLPGQTLSHWQSELTIAAGLNPEHISAYALTLEEKTPLYSLTERGSLLLPPDDEAAAIFALTSKYLATAGYEQYEISNFARPGRQSRHNLAYWHWAPYLGFGAGAHSFLPFPFPGERWSNCANADDYITTMKKGLLPELEHSSLSIREASAEWLFLGLRTRAGIDPEQFQSFFGFPVEGACEGAVADLLDEGLIVREAGRVRLPDSAFIISNQIFMRLV